MLYAFIKQNGNAIRVGAEDLDGLLAKIADYKTAGYEDATAEEYDDQVIGAYTREAAANAAAAAEVEAPAASGDAPAAS